MKRFIGFCVVIVMVVSMTSSFAVDVYEVESDVQSFDLSSSLYSISPLATGDSAWTSSNVTTLLNDVRSIQQSVATSVSGSLKSLVQSLLGSSQNIYSALLGPDTSKTSVGRSAYNMWQMLNASYTGSALTGGFRTYVEGGNMSVDLKPVTDMLGFPSGKSFWNAGYYKPNADGTYSFDGNWYDVIYRVIWSNFMRNSIGFSAMGQDGTVSSVTSRNTVESLNYGILGLGSIMRGQSGSTIAGSILSSSEVDENGQLKATEFRANNLLSMMSPLLDIQNDLARITHVVADPVDQALKNANEDNIKEVTDKLTGDKGLKPSDIGDMSSVGSQIGDMIAPDISVGDAFSQASSDEAWGFFSQSVADELEPQNAARARSRATDDDFISFIAMNEAERDRLLGKGSSEP